MNLWPEKSFLKSNGWDLKPEIFKTVFFLILNKNRASYNAVPSILIVAPIGNTNRVILGSIPIFCSKLAIVTGIVAELEAVAKAVNNACEMPLKNRKKSSGARSDQFFVPIMKIIGKVKKAWIARPPRTVPMYFPSRPNVSTTSSIRSTSAAMRKIIPIGAYQMIRVTILGTRFTSLAFTCVTKLEAQTILRQFKS